MNRQVGVDRARALARRARALGVGAEQRGLDAVGLGERLADRVEQPGVGRRVGPPRAPDRRLVDDVTSSGSAGRLAVDQRALARARHAGDDGEHAERDRRRSTSRRLCSVRAARSAAHPVGLRADLARSGWRGGRGDRPVSVPDVAQPGDVTLVHDVAAGRARRPDRGRRRGRRSRSPRACARRPARCCPCPAAAAAGSFIRWMSCGCSPTVGSSKT